MEKLIYPELSYEIVGILYEAYNQLSYGLQEKYYQRAIKKLLDEKKIPCQEQFMASIEINGENIGRYYFDFLVDQKIILEIKVGNHFKDKNIAQVYAYLKKSGLKLGILAQFTKNGVRTKRIVNIR